MEKEFFTHRAGSIGNKKTRNLEIKDFFKVYKIEQPKDLFTKLSKNFYTNRIGKNSLKHYSNSPSGSRLEKISLVSKTSSKLVDSSITKKSLKIVTVPTSFTPNKIHSPEFLKDTGISSIRIKTRNNSSKGILSCPLKNDLNEEFFIASRTRVGGFPGKPKKFNQDSFLIISNNTVKASYYILAVMDGHGQYGHLISNFIKSEVVKLMSPILSNITSSVNIDSKLVKYIQQSIKLGFRYLQETLISNKEIDSSFSGSTVVITIIFKTFCITVNLGDSRAVLGKFDNEWRAVSLSHDHKPSKLHEKRRIEKAGGRIAPCKDTYGDFVGPERVWCKDEPVPGLAVSRSLGDQVGGTVGVSSEPEVQVRSLVDHDKIFFVASDGVWEVMENGEVINLLAKYYGKRGASKAADKLMEVCLGKWSKKGFAVDDITFIILFIH
jgi:serine/threonine protein phosphatase PrpC